MDESILRKRSEVLVIAFVGKDLAPKWWDGFNKAFNMTPNEMWAIDHKAVYSYLMGMGGGCYS